MLQQHANSKYQKNDVPKETNKIEEVEVPTVDCTKVCFKVSRSTLLRNSSNVEKGVEDNS